MIEIPGYTLLRSLGRGGMGEVHLALQQSLGREVALKLLSPTLTQDERARDRFVREARIAANLHHPHIVPIYDVGVHGGSAYIAMEYEPGGTISELTRQPSEPAAALRIVRDIAAALDYAHRQGVVHRDVKPDNILRRADGLCLLSDFGIARAVAAITIVTQEGASVGTPQYMSPEQLRGQNVSSRADLYSLGVVLFQLLAGALPYNAPDGWALGIQHINDPIPRLPAGLEHLQALIDCLMAKDPGARLQTGADVVARIDSLLTGTASAITRRLETWPAALSTQPLATPPVTPGAEDRSIAVLPFADMSQGRDQEYFSDGLAEELLNLLAQLPQLRVIARTSSFSFKGKNMDVATIAKALNVTFVLEGSVRKSGNTLRVTAQLIRAADSSHLWSQTFNRELTDVFEVQDEIAGAVVAALKLKLLPNQQVLNAHRTDNAEAHDQYLLGHAVFRRGKYEDFREALVAFQRAIELDPNYAAAYAGLATAQNSVADFAPDFEQRAKLRLEALATAERAIALAPDLADGHVVRGQLRYRQLWEWQGALADLQRALSLEPGSSDVRIQYALALHHLERTPEAIAVSRKVTVDDPLLWLGWLSYGAFLRNFGRLSEARVALQRAIELNPESSWTRHVLGGLELLEGKAEAALAVFQQSGSAYRLAGLAMAEHSLGHARESAQALAELEAGFATGFSLQIAEAHAWRGDIDAAFEWLDRACEQRDSGIPRLRGNPFLRALRGDARYAELLERLNFPKSDAAPS